MTVAGVLDGERGQKEPARNGATRSAFESSSERSSEADVSAREAGGESATDSGAESASVARVGVAGASHASACSRICDSMLSTALSSCPSLVSGTHSVPAVMTPSQPVGFQPPSSLTVTMGTAS